MSSTDSFWSRFKSEFKLWNFRVDHPEPHLFLSSEWSREGKMRISVWYMVYRWLWALYHLGWWIGNLVLEGDVGAPAKRKAYHFIYLTNWAYISIVVMNLVHAVIITISWFEYRRTAHLPKTMVLHVKVLWVLQNIVFLPALLITAAYWSAIYDPSNPITALNAEVHIINSVYVIIDLWVVASPIRIYHFYIPFTFMVVYLIFTLIYWAVGGKTPEGSTAIYPIMDWDNLKVTIPFVVCCAVFSPVMQGIVWLIYQARLAVRDNCCGGKSVGAGIPHENTMDGILGRDPSMESVSHISQRNINTQRV
ncbi:hypothetical protein SK128_024376 [Halocaridina rubra]|uniref:Protein rolling stone n=1 Tax=Halocaridina rubra TaxID=373956 RepID=A0AAN9ADB1_HALRR